MSELNSQNNIQMDQMMSKFKAFTKSNNLTLSLFQYILTYQNGSSNCVQSKDLRFDCTNKKLLKTKLKSYLSQRVVI